MKKLHFKLLSMLLTFALVLCYGGFVFQGTGAVASADDSSDITYDTPADDGVEIVDDEDEDESDVEADEEWEDDEDDEDEDEDESPEEGDYIESSAGDVYEVVSYEKTVIFSEPRNTSIKRLEIPATIRDEGVTYKVIGVDEMALSGCKKLRSVILGKNVKSIGKRAFSGCTSLSKLKINAKRMAASNVGAKAFARTPKNATISFGKGKKNRNKAKDFYKKLYLKRR